MSIIEEERSFEYSKHDIYSKIRKETQKYWSYITFYVITGLKSYIHARVPVQTMGKKALERTRKN